MIFVKFLCVGMANTSVGLAAIYLAMYFLRLDDITANALGYGVGILLGFALNKRWTFANRDGLVTTLVRYLIVIAMAYVINITVVLSVEYYLGVNSYLAQATGIIPYTLFAFVGSRYYAFRNRETNNSMELG